MTRVRSTFALLSDRMTKMRYAFVFLVCLSLAAGGFAIMFSIGYYHREQGAQRAQGAALEQKLCTTLDRLAALKPPQGSPADLSRAYLLAQHQVLAELGPDVGCR